MEFIDEALIEYSTRHSSPLPDYFNELERETHLKTMSPQMLSGSLMGRFYRLLTQIHAPRRILEIGTFTGYSALSFAEGLPEDGIIHTIESDRELEHIIDKYLEKSGHGERIEVHFGDALEVIPELEEPFDLVFLDADKVEYPNYYELVFDKVPSGGLMLVDNTLWSGKVLEEEQDEETAAIDHFNTLITEDERLDNVLLPLRDGLMLGRKK